MKSESLVIAGQHTAVNTFPGLVHTARHTTVYTPPVTPRKPFTPEAGVKPVEGRGGDWGEVVTR